MPKFSRNTQHSVTELVCHELEHSADVLRHFTWCCPAKKVDLAVKKFSSSSSIPNLQLE